MTMQEIEPLLTDEQILIAMGRRMALRRLEMGLTQAELARQAGIGKRTVERMEPGRSAQMMSVIRVLRVLKALGGLDQLLPESGPSPMDLLKTTGKKRKRASSTRRVAEEPAADWKWGDES